MLRRSAHTLGRNRGPTPNVLSRLNESLIACPSEPNHLLNIAASQIDVHIGQQTQDGYNHARDAASEAYYKLIAPKIRVQNGQFSPRSNSQTQPVHASPSNIANLCLMESLLLALTRGSPKMLADTVCVAGHYQRVAGNRLDGPGQGSWQTIVDSLDNTDQDHCKLAGMIMAAVAPTLPTPIKAKIIKAGNLLVRI